MELSAQLLYWDVRGDDDGTNGRISPARKKTKIQTSAQNNTSFVSVVASKASGRRSKNAAPKSVPAANAAR